MIIGLVVGETSGDLLGADLIRALIQQLPEDENLTVMGVLGPNILALATSSGKVQVEMLYPMKKLAVMGLIEPLRHLPTLLKIRRHLIQFFIQNKQKLDCFIGIDAPDFNLGLEWVLKKAGIKTFHYVSPSVWAWRQKRIFKIKQAIDGMLLLFPFEEAIYKAHGIRCQVVGHPFAEQIRPSPLSGPTRPLNKTPHLILLPGSRWSEIKRMGPLFLEVAENLFKRLNPIRISMPLICESHQNYLQTVYDLKAYRFPLEFITSQTRSFLEAARDQGEHCVALATSGTIALELMLLNMPMIVTYKMNPVAYWIVKCLVKLKYIALPNLLAGKGLVQEFIQSQAHVKNLVPALEAYLNPNSTQIKQLEDLKIQFQTLHQQLSLGGGRLAAQTILNWL